MKFKREIIAIILVICMLFMISAVSANDGVDEVVSVTNESLKTADVTSDDSLGTENDVESLGETDDGSFTALNKKINVDEASSNYITLEHNYTCTGSSDVINGYNSNTKGIYINRDITIDGQGYTIDADGNSRIFYFKNTALSVTLKNINFKNGYDTHGGAFYASTKNLDIINCTFENNYVATNQGGAFYIVPYSTCNIINSTFIKNGNITKDGGACYIHGQYQPTVNIEGSIFINNTGRQGSAIYFYSYNTATLKNSIFLNNGQNTLYKVSGTTLTIDYNWWGNTADNYDEDLSGVSGTSVNKWLFLNMSTNDENNLATVSLNNLYNNGVVGVYNDYALPTITLNVKNESLSVSKNEITIDQTGEATLGYALTSSDALLTVSYNTVEISKELYGMDSGSMADLNNKIQTAITNGKTEVKLHNDYVYEDAEDKITNKANPNNPTTSYNGIGINMTLTIDGQGHTIDGNNKEKARIFYFFNTSSNLTLKNINFINCNDQYGSAVYVTCKNLIIDNCTFTNGIASANPGAGIYANVYENYQITNTNFANNKITGSSRNGGAIALYTNSGTTGEITNCNFTNNQATYRGGAVLINSNNGVGGDSGTIKSCFFKGNSATGTANSLYIHSPGTYSLSNSVILDTGTVIFTDNEISIDNNWWGSTSDDYSTLDVGAIYGASNNKIPINTWLYLDVVVDNTNGNATISLNNLNDGNKYDDYELPEITLNVEATNANIDKNTVTLNENGQATVNYEMTRKIGTLKVSYGDIELTKEIKMPIEGTFTSLVNDIDEIEDGGTIDLSQDYHYNSTVDDLLTEGIVVTKSVTIDGHGFTIDGIGLSNIFYLNDGSKSLILKNIIFANAIGTNGAAIYFNGKKIEVDNCTFMNNTASSQGDAIYIADAATGDNKITRSTFINNMGSNSVAYINLNSNDINVSNSIFMNNVAEYNIKASGNVVADYNWWGNTKENYNSNIAKVDGITVTKWLFLNITSADMDAGVATVSLNNLYRGSSVGSYGDYAISPINVTLGGENAVTQYGRVMLNDNGKANYRFAMIKKNANLTASYFDITTKKEVEYIINDDGSFKALNDIIRFSSEDDIINLGKNYTFIDGVDTLTTGIEITKTITIDGHGFTIDGKGKAAIFLIFADNVVLKNINFINGASDLGGAIYFSAESITIDNCSFINNTASDRGGAFYGYVDDNMGSITNSKFINNSATNYYSAIFNYGYYGVIDKCIFINNTGTYTIYHQYSRDYVTNSIFLDNTATTIISGKMKNNWFGNTYDNYKSSSLSNILYLNIKFTENYAIVSLNNLYSSSSTSVYTDYDLPEITLNINSSTLNLETDKIILDSTGKAIVPYTIYGETGALTVSYNGISLTKNRVLPEFDTLQTLIDNADENSVIELDKDYTYTDADEITEGILINKNITIDGKGHSIDANEMTRIFNVQALNVTFKNLVFANGKSNLGYEKGNNGGAIYYNVDNSETITFNVINCTFVNNTADKNIYYSTYQGGAIYIKANDGTYNIKDSIFINNSAVGNYGGAIYFNTKDSKLDLYNSSFIGNKAIYNGALYIKTDNGETTIDKCLFKESVISTASWTSAGSAIILDSTNENGHNVVKNSIFIDNDGNAVKNNKFAFLLKNGTVAIDDNWWGTTTDNNIALDSDFTQGVTPTTWLFINSTVGKNKLQYNETTTVKYSLQSFDGTDVADFDNSKLPYVEFDVSCGSGELDKDHVCLNEEFTFTKTELGSESIDIYSNNRVFETWIYGYYMAPKVEMPFTIYANQNYINKNSLIKTANGYYSHVTVTCNDSSLLRIENSYIFAYTNEGTAKLTFSYDGYYSGYSAEDFEMVVKVVKVPLNISITNIESNEITLNLTDTLDLDISFEVDSIHKGYAPAWNTLGVEYNSSVITFTYDNGERPDNGSYYPTGHITAKAGGTTNLTIYCTSDKFTWENYTIRITVNKIPTEITINDINPLKVDDESSVGANFYVNGTLNTATTLSYESSDESVATVDSNGLITALGNGTAIITVKFKGNSTHENSSKSITVTVIKHDSEISLSSNNLTPEYLQTIIITPAVTPAEATGTITYYIGDTPISEALGLTEELEFTVDRVGEFNITAKYSGDYKYYKSAKNITINSVKADNIIKVNVTKDKTYPDDVIVNITSLVPGDYTIDVNGTVLTVTIQNGETSAIVTHKFGAGEYYANITSAPTSGVYNQITQNDTFTVAKAINNAQIIINNQNYLPGAVTVNVTGLKGTYVVRFNNGQTVDVTVGDDGKGSNTVSLIAGEYTATLSLDNANYTTVADEKQFSVIKSQNIVEVIVADDNYLPGAVTVTVRANATGTYTVELNDTEKTKLNIEITSSNSEASATVYLKAGRYQANASFEDYDNYTLSITNKTFNVVKSDNIISIEVTSETYPDEVTIKVTATVDDTYNVKVGDIIIPVASNTDGVKYRFKASDSYTATIDSWSHDNYTAVVTDANFKVDKGTNNVEVIIEDTYLPGAVTVKVTADVDGVYKVVINTTEVLVDVKNGEGTNATYLAFGKYQANTTFADHENYTVSITNKTFSVIKSENLIVIEVTSETYPDEVTIKVTATVDDTYNVKVGDIIIPVASNTDGVKYRFKAQDSYTATIESWSHDNYTAVVTNADFKVDKGINNVVVTVEDKYLPGVTTVKVTANVDGVYKVTINTTEVLVDVKNGQGTNTTLLAAGHYSANTTFADHENYTVSITNTTFNVYRSNIDLTIFVDETVYGYNVTGYILTNVSGTYTLNIAGSEFTLDLNVGRNAFTRAVPLEVAEGYHAEVSIAQQPDYNSKSAECTFEVVQTSTDFNATSTKQSYVYGDEVILKIELPDDATGKVIFRYSNGTLAGEISDVTQDRELSLGILDVNPYTILANYSGDLNYRGLTKPIDEFNVVKADNNIEVTVISTSYPEEVLVHVNATVAGTYKVDINGTVLEVEANSTGVYHKFDAGSYYANITYNHKNYNSITKNTTFTVNKGINNIKVIVTSVSYPNNVTVKVIADVDGTYTVDINGTLKDIVANGEGISLKLGAGKYYANITGYTSDNYIGVTQNTTFAVDKAIAVVVVSVEDTVLPGDTQIKVISNIPGTYTVKISNGETVDVVVSDGEGTATITLSNGTYTADTTFTDYENYTVILTNAKFDVVKSDNHITVEVENVTYPDEVTVKVIADIAGTYTVDINGSEYEIVANSTGIILNLAAGNYLAGIINYASPYYNGVIENAQFEVKQKTNNVKIIIEDTVLPGMVTVNVTADVDGLYVVDINGTLVNVHVKDGLATNETRLEAGLNYVATTTFKHQNYTADITDAVFDVTKSDNHIKVTVESVEYPGDVTIRVSADIEGTYTVDVNGTIKEIAANGEGITLKLKAGEYYANITGYSSPDYNGIIENAQFSVNKKANNIEVIVENTVLPGDVTVRVTAGVDGLYVVDINGTLVNVEVTEASGLNTTHLEAGESYFATTSFADSENYTVNIINSTFNVEKSRNFIDVVVESVEYPNEVTVYVYADIDGTYTVDINGTIKEIVANGEGFVLKLKAGEYYANITGYSSPDYTGIINNAQFSVNRKTNNVEVIVGDTVLPGDVTVKVTAGVDGLYVVDINGTLVNVEVTEGSGLNTTHLEAGESYLALTSFADTENYTVNIINSTFDVDKSINNIEVIVENTVLPGDVTVRVTADVDGLYVVDINGTLVNVEVTEGSGLNTTHLDAGSYVATTSFIDTENYTVNVINSTFDVIKGKNNIKVIVDNVKYPQTVNVKVQADIDGKYTVDINGDLYEIAANSEGIDILLGVDDYYANITGYVSDIFEAITANATFTVSKGTNNVRVTVDKYVFGGNALVKITADVDGAYAVKIGDKTLLINVNGGKGENTTQIDEGEYTTQTSYANANYSNSITESAFKVLPYEISDNLTIRDAGTGYEVTGEGSVIINIEYYLIKPDDGITAESMQLDIDGVTQTILLIESETFTKVEFKVTETSIVNVKVTYQGTHWNGTEYSLESNTLTYNVTITNSTVSMTIPDTAYPNNATVHVKAGTDGVYLIKVSNKTYEANVINGTADVTLDLMGADEYVASIVYALNESIKNQTAFKITKASDINLNITIDDGVMTITDPLSDNGNVTVTINGKPYNATLVNGSATVDIDLYPGIYTATLSYSGDVNYENITKDVTLNVPKFKTSLEDALNITTPEGTTSPVVNITLAGDATGNITLILDGNKTYNATLSNGSAGIPLGELSVGTHNITIIYTGDGNYTESELNTTFDVSKAAIPENSTSIDITTPERTTAPIVNIKLPGDVNGNITITVDGNKTYNAAVVNGTANLKLDEMDVGEHTLSVTYAGDDKYDSFTSNATFTVPKVDLLKRNLTVTTDLDVGGKTPKLLISLPSDASGYVVVDVNGMSLYAPVTNGSATINLPAMDYGKHIVNVSYYGNDKYNPITKNKTVKVPKPKLTAKSVSIGYSGVVKYTVRLTISKKPVAGKYVTVSYKGKTYKAKTNKNGYATFKLATKHLKIGKYSLKSSFNDVSKTKKLTVKNVIKAKNLKAKKSKKKVIKIKLKKVNGKFLKGKKIKLKFKGKTYKAKTNKKGVAKFTIKKKVMKKLKVGKKYKYKVTYGKNKVTKKIKIKR